MTKDHGPSIKDDDTYEALREDGASKQKAAAIANAQANDSMKPSKKGRQTATLRGVDEGRFVRTRAGVGDRRAVGHDQGRADRGVAQQLTLWGDAR